MGRVLPNKTGPLGSRAARRVERVVQRRQVTSMLPDEAPLAMPVQDFDQLPRKVNARPERWTVRFYRWLLVSLALIFPGLFAWQSYEILAAVSFTHMQAVFLVFSTLAFAWVAFGSVSAVGGFIAIIRNMSVDTVRVPRTDEPPSTRTALLFPIYHEDPAVVAATIRDVAADLQSMNVNDCFDVFVLSDSRGQEAEDRERSVIEALVNGIGGTVKVYYRRRVENTARKSGNISDWVEHFGGAYASFIIFDADSVMTGEALVRLVRTMEHAPEAGLIQTMPRLAGGTTVFAHLQEFAANVYGPIIVAGLALWHGRQGNYWGHNAIIRTAAFAAAAGLPELAGRRPLGGHIQSHDFVEAALLQRAGWGVHMIPSLAGSYEGCPPTVDDLIVRDRRWCQGNLQHSKIVTKRGLTPMARVHLGMGILSYLASPVWALTLVLGLVLALQAQQILPSYFTDEKSLFPKWPMIDAEAAMALFAVTMVVVLLPKILGLIAFTVCHGAARFGALLRAVLVETVFSMLLAPIFMVTQTRAVAEVLLGLDSGWRPQRRIDGHVSFRDSARLHVVHCVIGVAIAAIALWFSIGLALWMMPLYMGLILAIPLAWVTAQPCPQWLKRWLTP